MKKDIILLFIFYLAAFPDPAQCQEKLQPVVVSPFIGDKLDRVEEDYFKIFPGFADFREAIFYINNDSSLNVKIKIWRNNSLIDTAILYTNSLSYLRKIIDQRILEDIRQNKVKELKFTTITDSIFDGIVYSYENRNLGLIKKGFVGTDGENDHKDYLQRFNYFHFNTITVQQTVLILHRSPVLWALWQEA